MSERKYQKKKWISMDKPVSQIHGIEQNGIKHPIFAHTHAQHGTLLAPLNANELHNKNVRVMD